MRCLFDCGRWLCSIVQTASMSCYCRLDFETSQLRATAGPFQPCKSALAVLLGFSLPGLLFIALQPATGLPILTFSSTFMGGYGRLLPIQCQHPGIGTTCRNFAIDQTKQRKHGPRANLDSQYSTDGTTFTTFGSGYSVLANAAPNPLWNATTSSSLYTSTVDFSSVTALNNDSTVYFRLVDTSTTSANGGVVGTGGTDRVDNFTVVSSVPEPTTLALSGMGGLFTMLVLRRKR